MARGRKAEGRKGPRRLVNNERAIASLERQAQFWEERARKMRDAVEGMKRELREAERGGREIGLPRGPGRPPGRGKRSRKGEGVGAMSAKVLREWRRPARVNELLPELSRRGVTVGGKRPQATLNSTLLKFPGVKRVARGLFAHADWSGDLTPYLAASPGAVMAVPAPAAAEKAKAPAAGGPAKAAVKRRTRRGRRGRVRPARPAKAAAGVKPGRPGRRAKIVPMPPSVSAPETPPQG